MPLSDACVRGQNERRAGIGAHLSRRLRERGSEETGKGVVEADRLA